MTFRENKKNRRLTTGCGNLEISGIFYVRTVALAEVSPEVTIKDKRNHK